MKENTYIDSPSEPITNKHKKDDITISPSFSMKKKLLSSPYQTPSRGSVRPNNNNNNNNINFNLNKSINKSISKPSISSSTSLLDISMFGNEDKSPMKVYLRIRPLSQDETKNKEPNCFSILSNNSVSIKSSKSSETENRFSFNSVFPTSTTQFELFKSVTYPLVQSFLSGHNILLLSYGITNAGKTYTISGNAKDPGIIPRTLDLVFKSLPKQCLKRNDIDNIGSSNTTTPKQHKYPDEFLLADSEDENSDSDNDSEEESSDSEDNIEHPSIAMPTTPSTKSMSPITISDQFNYSVWISYYEIYKKSVYDLLDESKDKKSLKIESEAGQVSIKNLKEVLVASADEARDVIEQGENSRRVGGTKLNKTSSRSHAILTIKLFAYPRDKAKKDLLPSQIRCSKLTIIDLAGCERAGRTEATGERLKEASNINTSLFILGKCIESLKQNSMMKNQTVIPWRESDLTRICQEYFVSNGKAAMIVNVSPTEKDADETLNVLRFSASAKEITTQSKIKQIPIHMNPPPSQPITNNMNQRQSLLGKRDRSTMDIQNSINEMKKKIHLDNSNSSSNISTMSNNILKDNINILNNASTISSSSGGSSNILNRLSIFSRKSILPINQNSINDYYSMEKDQLINQIQDYQKRLFDYEIKMSSLNIQHGEEIHREIMKGAFNLESQFEDRLAKESKLLIDQFKSKLQLIKNVNLFSSSKLNEQLQNYKDQLDYLKEENKKMDNQYRSYQQEQQGKFENLLQQYQLLKQSPRTPPSKRNVKTDDEWILEITEIQCSRDQLQNKLSCILVKLEEEKEKHELDNKKSQELFELWDKERKMFTNKWEMEREQFIMEIELLKQEKSEFIKEIETYQKQRDLELRELREELESQYQESREKLESTHRLENQSLSIQLLQEKKEKQSIQEDLTKWKIKAEESTCLLNNSITDILKDKHHHGSHTNIHGSGMKVLKSNTNIFTTPMKTKVLGKLALVSENAEQQKTLYKGDVEKSLSGQGVSVRFKDTEIIPRSPLAPGTPSKMSSQTPDRLPMDPKQYNDNGLLMREMNENDFDIEMNDNQNDFINLNFNNQDDDNNNNNNEDNHGNDDDDDDDDWLEIDIKGDYNQKKDKRKSGAVQLAKSISKSTSKFLNSIKNDIVQEQESVSPSLSVSQQNLQSSNNSSITNNIGSSVSSISSLKGSTNSSNSVSPSPLKQPTAVKNKNRILNSITTTPKKIVSSLISKPKSTTSSSTTIPSTTSSTISGRQTPTPSILSTTTLSSSTKKPAVPVPVTTTTTTPVVASTTTTKKIAKTKGAPPKSKISPIKKVAVKKRVLIPEESPKPVKIITTTAVDDTKTTVITSTRRKLTPKSPVIEIDSSDDDYETTPIPNPNFIKKSGLRRRSLIRPPPKYNPY